VVLCSDAAAGSTPFAVRRKEGETEVLRSLRQLLDVRLFSKGPKDRKFSKEVAVGNRAAKLHHSPKL